MKILSNSVTRWFLFSTYSRETRSDFDWFLQTASSQLDQVCKTFLARNWKAAPLLTFKSSAIFSPNVPNIWLASKMYFTRCLSRVKRAKTSGNKIKFCGNFWVFYQCITSVCIRGSSGEANHKVFIFCSVQLEDFVTFFPPKLAQRRGQ